jgi:transposase-like protein
MEERLRFVARLLDGEGVSDLCREFGTSRKTSYKVFNRYKDEGLEPLTDRSRRPVRYANQLPEPIERMIVRLKNDNPRMPAAGFTAPVSARHFPISGLVPPEIGSRCDRDQFETRLSAAKPGPPLIP